METPRATSSPGTGPDAAGAPGTGVEPAASRWERHVPAGERFEPGRLTEGASLPAAWAAHWGARPSDPVLLVEGPQEDAAGGHRPGTGARAWCCAGELEERSRAAARALAAGGLVAGERMVWSASPSLTSIVACVAALRLGAVVVPVNTAYTERELGHVVRSVRPRVAVVERREQATWCAAASGGRASVLTPGLAPAEESAGARRGGAEAPALDRAGADDPALIVFTSGTTGSPKGAVLTHANLLAGARTLALAWRWQPDDRLVLALPLFHVHGLAAGLFGTLAAGASAVVVPRFSADAVLDAAAAHGATLFFGVPTMYRRLLDGARAAELGRLRLCVSGSAPLPAPLWQQARQDAGVAVLERYGMTETLLTVSNPHDGDRRPGTVGFPLPGVTARLAPADTDEGGAGSPAQGAPDRDGGAGDAGLAEGQLLVRGPTVFAGYWERPAATEAAFDGPWFRTGDMMALDADGYLSVRGRRSDLVLSGGYNVYPAEVEDVLLAHPGVAEAAVTGMPSEEWGESVVAWVVAAGEPPAPADLAEFAATRLAPYKRPREFRMVDSLPRNALGKIQRHELS